MICIRKAACRLIAVLPFIAGASGTAAAQPLEATGPPADAATASSTVVYDRAYFEAFGAVTLEDMIRNIPGGIALLNSLRRSSDRGFGSDGPPLLIDGRRMTGKSNDIVTRLARIPANQVERIELIRGNAAGLDIRSEGLLYNVILRKGADRSASTFFDLRANYARGAPLGPQALLSHSGRDGRFEYGVSYQYENDPRVNLIREDVLSPDGVALQFSRPHAEVHREGQYGHRKYGLFLCKWRQAARERALFRY